MEKLPKPEKLPEDPKKLKLLAREYIIKRCREWETYEEQAAKALVFVEHIEKHLKYMRETPDSPMLKVICKICGKTIDEIYAEEQK